jgi:Tn7-like transposition protein D/TniQ
MHGHFPIPHPNELLYGICARLSERANVPSKKGFCEFLFGAGSIAVVDLPSRLQFVAAQLPPGGPNAKTLLRNHTVLPLYLPFLPKGRAEKCKQAALGGGGKSLPFLTGVMASKIEQPTNLRLCPLCAAEDNKAFGEPYWHRSHQVPGVTTCYRHGIRLLEMPTRRGSRLNRHEFYCPPKNQQEIEGATTEGDGCLARDTHWLLNGNDCEPGLDLLKENYLIALQEKRLAHLSGRAYITRLTEQFIEHHGDELLVILGCPLSTEQNSSWLADMLRDRPRCAHPIQHLLLINFLGHTAQSFFEILAQERKKPKCAALSPQKETKQKQIDQRVLAKLWTDRQISLREIGRRLKVDPMTVKRHAARAGLRFPREGVRPTRNRPPQPKERRKRLDLHRRRWEMALAQTDPHGLRKRLPNTYSYLFRFDREWLDRHRPPPLEPKPRKPRVDWHARDKELAEKIREIVIRSPEPLTRGKLLAELGIENMLRRNPNELKRTREEILKACVI